MERGREFFDEYAASWDARRNTDEARLAFLLSLADIPHGDILDVGTGTGVLIPYLLKAAGEDGSVTAVDYSPKMLAVAEEKFAAKNLRFICDDILSLELKDESFDFIVSLNFFPHLTGVDNKRAYLKKMYAALKRGGKIVVMHDISREQVNGIHSHAKETFDDRLPAARDTATLFAEAGLACVRGIEDDFVYFVCGVKQS